jgi:hypothetical protein
MDPDQTARMRRLVWIDAGRNPILLVLSWRGSFHIQCDKYQNSLKPLFKHFKLSTDERKLFLRHNVPLIFRKLPTIISRIVIFINDVYNNTMLTIMESSPCLD